MRTLLSGAKVYRNGCFEPSDICVEDGVVSFITAHDSLPVKESGRFDLIFEINDRFIFPGFTDVHVHFREPGFCYKEDTATGSSAAAAGGYTTVCTMPNLSPVPDCPENLRDELSAIREKAVVRVLPYISISKGEKGEALSEIDEIMAMPELKDGLEIAGFSDDGVGVVSDDMMRSAMLLAKKYGRVIAAHCEYKSLMGGKNVHAGRVAELLGIQGISSESEWKMIERDLRIAAETGCSYHVCHISTRKSVELIAAAKKAGVNVTCETGPHYLLLSEEDIVRELEGAAGKASPDFEADKETRGMGRFKMNPPLRSADDRLALIEGLLDGTIDMIATDHAPHSEEEKQKGFDGPMGVVGLECAFPVLYTGLVRKNVITLEKLIQLMSIEPQRRFFGRNAEIMEGAPADLTVFDLNSEYVIDPDSFKSKGRYTPFDGMKVFGRCEMTMHNGKVVYKR